MEAVSSWTQEAGRGLEWCVSTPGTVKGVSFWINGCVSSVTQGTGAFSSVEKRVTPVGMDGGCTVMKMFSESEA